MKDNLRQPCEVGDYICGIRRGQLHVGKIYGFTDTGNPRILCLNYSKDDLRATCLMLGFVKLGYTVDKIEELYNHAVILEKDLNV